MNIKSKAGWTRLEDLVLYPNISLTVAETNQLKEHFLAMANYSYYNRMLDKRLDENAYDNHKWLIVTLLNNMAGAPKYLTEGLIRMLGGSDEVGHDLVEALQEIIKQ